MRPGSRLALHRRAGWRALAIALCALGGAVPAAGERALQPDEEVLLFPALATRSRPAGPWQVRVHGWVYEPESDDPLRLASLAATRSLLGLPPGSENDRIFRARVAPFLFDNERGRVVRVRVSGIERSAPPSAPDGHFELELELPAGLSGPRPIEVVLPAADPRHFTQRAHLVEPEGILVVSDIDDTVKVSHVGDTSRLLRATFLDPFEAVPGMAERYRAWALEAGAHLHFVSASPWQLYAPLHSFLAEQGFPEATFSLKRIRLKDPSALALVDDPLAAKTAAIEALLARLPARRVVLVGDSGERDPEVYAGLARSHPTRIEAIYIRDVTGQARDDPRYARAFDGVPSGRWMLFRSGEELPDLQRREAGGRGKK